MQLLKVEEVEDEVLLLLVEGLQAKVLLQAKALLQARVLAVALNQPRKVIAEAHPVAKLPQVAR
jgi:hypothetical protein